MLKNLPNALTGLRLVLSLLMFAALAAIGAALSGADIAPQTLPDIGQILNSLGQKPFSAPSPKGWPEEAEVWCAPDAVIKRMAWAQNVAAQSLNGRDPNQLADDALGARLTPLVAKAISRAETREEGLAILLMSPEFQRR